jgi:hypothetical protein
MTHVLADPGKNTKNVAAPELQLADLTLGKLDVQSVSVYLRVEVHPFSYILKEQTNGSSHCKTYSG